MLSCPYWKRTRPRNSNWITKVTSPNRRASVLFSFPIPDRGVPASTREALSLFSTISAALEAGKNVAVHCRQGIGRSGLIAAGVLLTSGMGVDKALELVGAARGEVVPETQAQLQWIKHLPSEHLVPTA